MRGLGLGGVVPFSDMAGAARQCPDTSNIGANCPERGRLGQTTAGHRRLCTHPWTTSVVLPAPTLVDKLVIATRILSDQGIVDGLGHASVRHDSAPGVFLLSCNRAPGLVVRADIVCYDLDGNAVSATPERSYLERFIHSEIYRARPDVGAVVHSHSASVIPFGVTGHRLRPIFHMAGFLGSGAAHFEIRETGGNTDMLIRSPALGEALAQSLGPQSCVLMRGHGPDRLPDRGRGAAGGGRQ